MYRMSAPDWIQEFINKASLIEKQSKEKAEADAIMINKLKLEIEANKIKSLGDEALIKNLKEEVASQKQEVQKWRGFMQEIKGFAEIYLNGGSFALANPQIEPVPNNPAQVSIDQNNACGLPPFPSNEDSDIHTFSTLLRTNANAFEFPSMDTPANTLPPTLNTPPPYVPPTNTCSRAMPSQMITLSPSLRESENLLVTGQDTTSSSLLAQRKPLGDKNSKRKRVDNPEYEDVTESDEEIELSDSEEEHSENSDKSAKTAKSTKSEKNKNPENLTKLVNIGKYIFKSQIVLAEGTKNWNNPLTQKVRKTTSAAKFLNLDKVKFAKFLKSHGLDSQTRSVNMEEVQADLETRISIMSGAIVDKIEPWKPLVDNASNGMLSSELTALYAMAMCCFPGKDDYVAALIYCISRHSYRSIKRNMDTISKKKSGH